MTLSRSRRFSMWAACLGMIILTGCIDIEKWDLHFDIANRNQVRVTHRFYGIHSTNESEEDQLEEMKSFYESGYLVYASDIAADWQMEHPVILLANKTDLNCDAEVSGHYSNLLTAFFPLLEESDYLIKNEGSTLRVTIWMPEEDRPEKTDEMKLQIKYPGQVLDHNAHVHLEIQGMLEWDLTLVDSSGIHFVLDLPE